MAALEEALYQIAQNCSAPQQEAENKGKIAVINNCQILKATFISQLLQPEDEHSHHGSDDEPPPGFMAPEYFLVNGLIAYRQPLEQNRSHIGNVCGQEVIKRLDNEKKHMSGKRKKVFKYTALSAMNGTFRSFFMALFTVTYAPKNCTEIVGQEKAVTALKMFVQQYRQQKQKAALLHGPIGTGKTSAVYAVAQELHADVFELNSSDLRNAEALSSFLNAVLGQQSLFMRPKIILIDEVDNISGVQDRGGIPALLSAIEKSVFPVVLTANDLYEQKLKPLRKSCLAIEFPKLPYPAILQHLQRIAQLEKLSYEEKALSALARQADGDLRSALLDLQTGGVSGKITFDAVSMLADRKRTQTILATLKTIFKSSSAETALSALDDVAVDLDEIFLWLDANVSKEYLSPHALAKAYEALSRADIFRGRIRKQQHWRFLVYVNNLLTAGISLAKDEKNPAFVPYQPTMRLLQIWQANQKQAKKKAIAEKLTTKLHASKKQILQQMPYLQQILKAAAPEVVVKEFLLNEEEVGWIKS